MLFCHWRFSTKIKSLARTRFCSSWWRSEFLCCSATGVLAQKFKDWVELSVCPYLAQIFVFKCIEIYLKYGQISISGRSWWRTEFLCCSARIRSWSISTFLCYFVRSSSITGQVQTDLDELWIFVLFCHHSDSFCNCWKDNKYDL